MGCHSFLQCIFPTQGSKLGLQTCRQIVVWLSHQESPILSSRPFHFHIYRYLCIIWYFYFFTEMGLNSTYWIARFCGFFDSIFTLQMYVLENLLHQYTYVSLCSQFSCSVVSDSLRPHELQQTRPPCPSPTARVYQTHVHWVGDAIQPSHPLSSPSPPSLNLSQHQGLFKWVSLFFGEKTVKHRTIISLNLLLLTLFILFF